MKIKYLFLLLGLVLGIVGSLFMPYVAENVWLYVKSKTDWRYDIVYWTEREYPGISVVNVSEEEVRSRGKCLEVVYTFDRRITEERYSGQDENGRSKIIAYVDEYNMALAVKAKDLGYDYITIDVIGPYTIDSFDGDVWTSDVFFECQGKVDDMIAWIESGADYAEVGKYGVSLYMWNPFFMTYQHNTYLPRPFEEPIWIQLEKWEEREKAKEE